MLADSPDLNVPRDQSRGRYFKKIFGWGRAAKILSIYFTTLLKTYSLKANDIFLGAFNLKSISFSASIFSDKTHL